MAKDTKYTDLREEFTPVVYVAATQVDRPSEFTNVVIRASTPLAAISPAATRAIAEVNPAIAVRYQTVREQIDQSLQPDRLMAVLSGFFGGLAVLIATIGLYGVMAYMVARRRVEIGIRMALGADRTDVVRLIVREAGFLLAAGLVIGLALAIPTARAASTMLYGLKSWDPATMAMSAAALAAVSLLASWLPARRASRVQPTVALREE